MGTQASIETLNQQLDTISRKFVHRNDADSRRGYTAVKDLCRDIDESRTLLETIDQAASAAFSEYWIRIFNDLVLYCEDWPLASKSTGAALEFARTIDAFGSDLLDRDAAFTQTQRTRILSIAMRAREATLQPGVSNVIERWGGTITLNV